MKTYKTSNWGTDTLQACRDIMKAGSEGSDIIVHDGDFNTESSRHLSTISRACVDSGVELVVRGVQDPEIVYPHITFIEE